MPTAVPATAQTARNTTVGRSSRAARARRDQVGQATDEEEQGMTWSSQVASHSPGIRVSALPPSTRPSRQTTTAISQCPATTTRMLATRSRSANRSRSAGVAAGHPVRGGPRSDQHGRPSRLLGPLRPQPGRSGHRLASGFGPVLGVGGTQVDLGTSGTQVGTVRVYGRFVEG